MCDSDMSAAATVLIEYAFVGNQKSRENLVGVESMKSPCKAHGPDLEGTARMSFARSTTPQQIAHITS